MESYVTSLQQQIGSLLEIIGVVMYFGLFLIGYLFTPVFLSLLFSPWFLLPLAYLTWMYFDRDTPRREGRPLPFIRKLFIWKYFARYFPCRLIKTVDLDPSKNYMFCYHPHGVIGISCFINFFTEANNLAEVFRGIKMHILTLNVNFFFPILRDYTMGLGLGSVTRDSINYKLTKIGPGHSVLIVVGGAAEAQLADPNEPYRIKIKSRKGFIREALKAGSPLVPVFSFGESEIFHTYKPSPKSFFAHFQNWVRRQFGPAPIMFYGNNFFLPLRKEINTVVGAPIHVPHLTAPTEEEITFWHAKYIEALQKLFIDNRDQYGRADKNLELH